MTPSPIPHKIKIGLNLGVIEAMCELMAVSVYYLLIGQIRAGTTKYILL